jgi:hypothetical protein
MALTIYPTTDWDSYISLADATTLMPKYVLDMTAWNALNDTQKEFYLVQSSLLIKNKITDPEETSTPLDLQIATVFLANYALGNDLTDNDGKNNVKIKEIVGVIKTEYFSTAFASNSFPDYVSMLLNQYGFISQSALVLDRS